MKLRAAVLSLAVVASTTLTIASFTPQALAFGVKGDWRAPAKKARKANPYPPGPHSIEQGESIFSRECRQCHGKSGLGNGDLAPTFGYPVTDLTSRDVMRQRDGALYWKIRKGRRDMPGYRHVLSKEEVWHVINYMRYEFE